MEEMTDPYSRHLINRHEPALFLLENLDISYIHGDFDDILSLPMSLMTPNLKKMMPLQDVLFFAESVKEVMKKEEVLTYKNKPLHKEKSVYNADISFQKIHLTGITEPVILVTFKFILQAQPTATSTPYNSESNLYKRLQVVEKELNEVKKKNEQMELNGQKKVRDLDSGYQQLMVSHEELQSSNEELQSVNEELHTVNEELHYKNRELQIANNDINNFLKSTDIGTIFLDSDLQIRRFTPIIRRQFDLLPSDVGRSIITFTSNLQDVDLEVLCRQVYNSEAPTQLLVTDTLDNDFLMRVLPYRDEKNEVIGIVITFIDLSKTKSLLTRYDESIRTMAHKFEAIYKNSNTPLVFIKKNGEITSINRDLGGYTSTELLGKSIFDIVSDEKSKELRAAFDTAFKQKIYQSASLDLQNDKTKDVAHFKIEIIPISDENNEDEVGLISLLATDTTEETKILQELETMKTTFMSFMENAQHQMVLLDKMGTIVHINSDKNSPYTKEELKGSVIYNQLPPSEVANYKKSIEEIFAGKSNSKIAFNYPGPDGVMNEVSVIATPVLHAKKVVYVALVGNPLEDL